MDLVVSRLSRPLIAALPHTPVGVCARMLVHNGIRHLPVIDEQGLPIGVLEDIDVFRVGALFGPTDDVWLAFDATSDRLRAVDVSRPLAGTCPVGVSTLAALLALEEGGNSAIGVVDVDGKLVGMFTEHDAAVVARDLVDSRRPVGDFATSPARTVDWMHPARDALLQLLMHRFRHLVVTKEGSLEGVVSARDLRIAADPDRTDWVVFDAMHSGSVFTATANESIREAAARMVQHKVGCLPVVEEDGTILGVVTRTDLLRASVEVLRGAGADQGATDGADNG